MSLLCTHADRQGVCLFYCLFFCVCTVTDFSTEDKANGVTNVQGRESPIIVNFAPPEAQNRANQRAGHAHPNVNIMVEMRRS